MENVTSTSGTFRVSITTRAPGLEQTTVAHRGLTEEQAFARAEALNAIWLRSNSPRLYQYASVAQG